MIFICLLFLSSLTGVAIYLMDYSALAGWAFLLAVSSTGVLYIRKREREGKPL